MIDSLRVAERELLLRPLHDATIMRPAVEEPAKYFRSYLPVASRAEHIVGGWSVLDPDLWARHQEWVVDGELSATFVFDRSILEPIRPRPPHRYVIEMAGSPNGAVYEYDGNIPTTLLIADETVFILLVGANGYQGVVVSSDETVLAWARTTFEAHREQADELDPDVLEL